MTKQKYMTWKDDLIENTGYGVQVMKRLNVYGDWQTYLTLKFGRTFIHGHKYIKVLTVYGEQVTEERILSDEFDRRRFILVETVRYNGGNQNESNYKRY